MTDELPTSPYVPIMPSTFSERLSASQILSHMIAAEGKRKSRAAQNEDKKEKERERDRQIKTVDRDMENEEERNEKLMEM